MGFGGESDFFDFLCKGSYLVFMDVRNDEVLPDGEADFPFSVTIGEIGNFPKLIGQDSSHGGEYTDIAKVWLFLGMAAKVSFLIGAFSGNALIKGESPQGEGEFFLGFFEKFLDSPVIDQVLEAGFFSVGAVAVLNENSDHSSGYCHAFSGGDQETGVTGELLVSSDATELEAEVDPVGNACLVFYFTGVEGDVVGIGTDTDGTATVEGNIEFAGEPVEIPIVEDAVVHAFGEGEDIDVFLRVVAAGGRGGNVADVIGSGSFRSQPDLVEV